MKEWISGEEKTWKSHSEWAPFHLYDKKYILLSYSVMSMRI